jgi:hypothetical protein
LERRIGGKKANLMPMVKGEKKDQRKKIKEQRTKKEQRRKKRGIKNEEKGKWG